jgi:probable phosphoglycerate mutase
MSVELAHIIRHGQTEFNTERRLQGAMPVPLNDEGRQQSHALGQCLQGWSIDAIYTSPRARAKETARIIGGYLGQSVYEDERLAEIAFGDFEGHTFAEVAQLYPVAYKKWESGYRPYRVPGGESRLDVQLRMEAAWRDITDADDGHATVAIVGHSSAMMIFLASMFAFLPSKPVLNTSITTLERYQDIWRIQSFAETPHLASASGSSL